MAKTDRGLLVTTGLFEMMLDETIGLEEPRVIREPVIPDEQALGSFTRRKLK
jgi:hypothetical protein